MKIGIVVQGTSGWHGLNTFLSLLSEFRSGDVVTVLRVSNSPLFTQLRMRQTYNLARVLAKALTFACIKFIEGIESTASLVFRASPLSEPRQWSQGVQVQTQTLRQPRTNVSGGAELEESDVDFIKSAEFDLIVIFGTTVSTAKLRSVARIGLLERVHHNRGKITNRFPGLAEVVSREDSSSYLIAGYFGVSKSGIALGSGATQVHWSARRTGLLAETKAAAEMARIVGRIDGLESISNPSAADQVPELEASLPELKGTLSYGCLFFREVVARLGARILGRAPHTDSHDDWNVGYKFGTLVATPDFSDYVAIDNPTTGFFADPFIIKRGGHFYCFVEEYSHQESRGRISVLKIERGGHNWLGVAIEEAFHLSFPYLFEHQGHLFMCPETSEIREIRLYRCIEFPLEWELEKTLISGVSAADNLVFRRHKMWWLLTNICSPDVGDHTSELHVYSSPELLEGIWSPHPLNPVISDSKYARNGGIHIGDSGVFRVSQRQGFDNYGQELGIARIDELSSTSYLETQVTRVTSKTLGAVRGIHTLSWAGDLVAFDFRKGLPKRNSAFLRTSALP